MDNFNTLIESKNAEMQELYQAKLAKNKKMTASPDAIDYNSKKTINQINAHLDKKRKSTKAYQKELEKELLDKAI